MTPLKMLFLLPLLALAGFEATLFTNFPFAWRLGGCPSAGLGACYPTSYNWANYARDMVFYTLLEYWTIIIGIGVRERLFTAPSTVPFWKIGMLKLRFKLALLGAFLMLAAPLLAFPLGPASTACLVPSPCQTREDQLMAGWNLTSHLWAYSILLTIFTAPLGVVRDKWHQYLGASFIGLAGLYLAGLEAFFTTGVYTLFSLEQTLIGTLALIPGPLFVISAGLLTLAPRHSLTDLLRTR